MSGGQLITDGPFVESKEHLGGFTIVHVADDDAARHWAGTEPTAAVRAASTTGGRAG